MRNLDSFFKDARTANPKGDSIETPEQKFIAFLKKPVALPQGVYRERILREYRKMRKAEEGPKWWDLHMHIAEDIAWGAGKLIKSNKGYPGEFDTNKVEGACYCPICISRDTKKPKEHVYSLEHEKRWLAILRDIQEGFQLYVDTYGDFHEWKDGKVPPTKWIKLPKGGSRMEPTPKGFRLIENKEKKKKFKRAFELFRKYFGHMWD